MMMEFLVVVFGAVIGSFLNVCIHRFPLEKSVIYPGSHCPECEQPVRWFDNIPLLSYVFLRGKCRQCSLRIPLRYFFVEAACALIWFSFLQRHGFTPAFVGGSVLFTLLLAVTVTDLETGLIPDAFTFTGVLCGLGWAALEPARFGQAASGGGIERSLLGLAAGSGILWLTGWLGTRVFRKESMGLGDVKLMAFLGAFLGIKKIVLVFLMAPFFALPVALYARLAKKSETIPFGPYLAAAGALLFLYGEPIIRLLGWTF